MPKVFLFNIKFSLLRWLIVFICAMNICYLAAPKALADELEDVINVSSTSREAFLSPGDVFDKLGLDNCTDISNVGTCINKISKKITGAKSGFNSEQDILDNQLYAEEQSRVFKIDRDDNQLEMTEKRRYYDKNVKDLQEALQKVSLVPANKFSLGNGYVDVTYQVRKGVRQALKDLFTGYSEVQRRKVAEEILNANFLTNEITSTFLLGSTSKKLLNTNDSYIGDGFQNTFINDLTSSFADIVPVLGLAPIRKSSILGLPFLGNNSKSLDDKLHKSIKKELKQSSKAKNIFTLTKKILKDDFVRNITGLFSGVARALLIIALLMIVFVRLSKDSFNLSFVIAEPVFMGIALWLIITNSDLIMGALVDGISAINTVVKSAITDTLRYNFINSPTEDIIDGWKFIHNHVGYLPVEILSVVNILLQLVIYFYLLGLILYLVIGKMVSPLWFLLFAHESTRSHAINSFINWIKVFLSLVFIPVLYLGIYLLGNVFANKGHDILNVVLSMAGLVLIPVISTALLSRASGGALTSFVGSYDLLLHSLQDSFSGLRQVIEYNFKNTQDFGAGSAPARTETVNQYHNSHNIQDGFRSDQRLVNSLHGFFDKVKYDTINSIRSHSIKQEASRSYDHRLGLNARELFLQNQQLNSSDSNTKLSLNDFSIGNTSQRLNSTLAFSLDKIIKLNRIADLVKTNH